MSLTDHKITDNDISTKGVSAAPDKLTGTAAENKALFDRLIREAVKDKINDLIDDLIDELTGKMPAPASMGADGQYLKSDGQGGVSWDTPAGSGDMLRSVYDTDEDGRVDIAERALVCSGNAATASRLEANKVFLIQDADGSNFGRAYYTDLETGLQLSLPAKIKAEIVGNVTGNVTGNVSGSAAKLKTARSLTIKDNSQTHAGLAATFDGSGNVILRLPATIAAALVGNVTGNVSGSAGSAEKLSTARTLTIKDGRGNAGTSVSFDGSDNVNLPLPTTIRAHLLPGRTVLDSFSYGDSFPSNPEEGRLFFMKVT